MAGGIGSRFWPLSRTSYPKQFLDILGTGKTLLQQTFERFDGICPKENILIVTNEQYRDLVKEQLPDLDDSQIIGEPARRNTAPCIAYATHKIAAINPDANIIVAPSDHLILKEDNFKQIIELGLNQTDCKECLVTLGIKPSRPDTGYGYIQFIDDEGSEDSRIKKVKLFTEKPDLEHAKIFLESGDFYWNSGIFIWNVKTILKAFAEHLPDVDKLFHEGVGLYNTPEEAAFIEATYPLCPNISIDYGIMEKAHNVNVLLSDFGWSDLGTWGSLHTHQEQDKEGNAVLGDEVMLYNSKDNIIHVPKEKLVVVNGLEGFIVVESNETLLICKKEDEQRIRQMVNDIRINKGDRYI